MTSKWNSTSIRRQGLTSVSKILRTLGIKLLLLVPRSHWKSQWGQYAHSSSWHPLSWSLLLSQEPLLLMEYSPTRSGSFLGVKISGSFWSNLSRTEALIFLSHFICTEAPLSVIPASAQCSSDSSAGGRGGNIVIPFKNMGAPPEGFVWMLCTPVRISTAPVILKMERKSKLLLKQLWVHLYSARGLRPGWRYIATSLGLHCSQKPPLLRSLGRNDYSSTNS